MKNSNMIHIALDYKKQEQRRNNAKKLAPITCLCNDKKLKFVVDIDNGITIGDKFFKIDEIDKAIKFVNELDMPNLNYY